MVWCEQLSLNVLMNPWAFGKIHVGATALQRVGDGSYKATLVLYIFLKKPANDPVVESIVVPPAIFIRCSASNRHMAESQLLNIRSHPKETL